MSSPSRGLVEGEGELEVHRPVVGVEVEEAGRSLMA